MKLTNQKGFSLTELLVVVAITGIVSTAIMSFFMTQQRSHSSQEQVTLVQQNARSGLGVMSRELRMAGYRPNKTGGAMGFLSGPDGGGVEQLGLQKVTFTFDLDEDGVVDSGEQVIYSFDSGNSELERNGSVLADGIAAVAFAFAYDSDNNGVLEPGTSTYAIAGADGIGPLNGTVNWFQVNADGSTTDTGTRANAAEIRAVKISILARAETNSQDFTNTTTYVVGTQTVSPTTANLHRRHLLLETVVRCRNMGLR